jgi:hypothetical protein
VVENQRGGRLGDGRVFSARAWTDEMNDARGEKKIFDRRAAAPF